MTPSDLLQALGSALYSTLAGGSALIDRLGGTAIYNTVAPQGASLPYVVFFVSAGRDINSSPRRARDYVVTVKAVTDAGVKAATELDGEIDAILHDAELDITGWGNYWTMRESDIMYTEVGGNTLYWHVGGQYRIRVAEP